MALTVSHRDPNGKLRFVPVAQPQTMIGFLKSIGGLRDCTELRLRDARLTWPGLVNNRRGKSLDYGREAAEEAGFLAPFASVSDFLDALDNHPHYRPADYGRLAEWQDQKAASIAEVYDDEFDDLHAKTAIQGKPREPERHELTDSENAASALAWRLRMKLSRAKLAAKTGFSPSQIQDYEQGSRRGKTGSAAAISADAWRRYQLACAAVQAGLKMPW